MAIINGGTEGGFPEPKALNILEIGDGKDHRNPNMVYSLENPHPGYGKDPNIKNELGHSEYPKMVYPNGNSQPGFLVNNEKEEKEALGQVPPHPTNVKAPTAALKDGGPTVEQFIAAGYKASDYPPKGYKPVSSEAEVKAAVEKETKAAAAPWG